MLLSELVVAMQARLDQLGDEEAHLMVGVKVEAPGMSQWTRLPEHVLVWFCQFAETDGPSRISPAEWVDPAAPICEQCAGPGARRYELVDQNGRVHGDTWVCDDCYKED